jgi:hypothetical protein
MVFFFIFYLLTVSLFCLPFSFRAKVHLGDKEEPYFVTVNVNRVFDIFPFRKALDKVKQRAKKANLSLKLKFPPTTDILKILTVYELKIMCHNISKYSTTAYNIGLALLQQFVVLLRSYDSLYDFDFTSTESIDNMPKIQLKVHIKINLFIIFSSFFKIIKVTKRSKQ